MSNPEIEDIYPLTPLQQGILFHTLTDPTAGFYIDQLAVEFQFAQGLQEGLLAAAFERLVLRHTVLRTALIWERQDQPLQVVLRQAALELAQVDWTGLDRTEQSRHLEQLLNTERARGFDLARPPLLRVACARTDTTTCYLVITYHHVILDAWSIANLFEEFQRIHRALREGHEPDLPPPRAYKQYVTGLVARERSDAEAFWRASLAGLVGPTELECASMARLAIAPGAKPSAGVCEVFLSEEATAALRATARSLAVTVATLVQGAWAILLSRYSDARTVSFGVTFAGRPADLEEASRMVGLFINTLPVRVEVTPEVSVAAWLRQLHEQLVEVRRHEFTSLQHIQDWVAPGPGVPLFQTVLAFENVPGLAGNEVASVEGLLVRNGRYIFRTNYPINVMVVPGERLILRINYDARRYSEQDVSRVLQHCSFLLEQLADDVARPLADLRLIPEAQMRSLRSFWIGPEIDYPSESAIHELFAAQVTRAPSRAAMVDRHGSWSYEQLDQRSNALAWSLRRLGIGPERRVALCAERSIEHLAAVLAILKVGGIYVPLDPAYPEQRIGRMLQVAEPSVVLFQRPFRHLVEHAGHPLLELEGAGGERVDMPRVSVDPLNGAYVIFTSGSSGTPKGIELGHRGLCNMIVDWNRQFDVREGDRLLQFASISFDASVWEIFSALTAGATLCVASRATLYSANELLEALRSLKITHALLPPSLLGSLEPDGLESLRCIAAIGERCTQDIVQRWSKGRRFFNAYGPAEATITDIVYELQPTDLAADPPIGRPMANVACYSLKADLQPAPVGVAGELFISGVNVARGYIRRPGATAEKFLPDPYSSIPGSRMYRTGDLVRLLESGNLQFLGRADSQVKIRGVRIELGEVEDALREHAAIRDAVVLAREGPDGTQRRLVAYFVPHTRPPELSELRQHLRRLLPEVMVPAAFVALVAFPVSANGKIDRSKLPDPQWKRSEALGALAEPTNETERRLAEVWRRVLRLERVGIHDNYFDLGGDSIVSIRLVAAAQRAGLVFSPRQVLENQTIAQLAAVIGPADTASGPPGAEGTVLEAEVVALPIQQSFLRTGDRGLAHYNQAVILRLEPDLGEARLRAALQAVVDRHDGLRVAVEFRDGPRLRIRPPGERIELEVLAMGVDPQDRMDRIQRELDPHSGRTFSALLIPQSGAGDKLFLAAHHLAVDAISWGILLDDLASACMQESLGPPPPSFAKIAAELRQAVLAGALDAQVGYWSALLEQRPVALGYMEAGRPLRSGRIQLSAPQTSCLLRTLPDATHAGDLVLAALAQACGGGSLIDMEAHGRHMDTVRTDCSRTVAWFTAIAPYQLPDSRPISAATLREHATIRSQWEAHAYSFGALLGYGQSVALEPLRAASPRRILFNWLGGISTLVREDAPFRLSSESVGAVRDPGRPSDYALELDAWLAEEGLVLSWATSDSESGPVREIVAAIHRTLSSYAEEDTRVDSDLSDADLRDALALVADSDTVVPDHPYGS
jgi:amino acid adenylation domain-containing protein